MNISIRQNVRGTAKYLVWLFLMISQTWALAEEWQKGKLGNDYQITGMTKEQIEKIQPALERWQNQTNNFFREMEASGINTNTFNYQQRSFERIQFGLVYSYDMRTVNKLGVPIIAVSPAGVMAMLGIRSGDVISKINDRTFNNKSKNNKQGKWIAAVEMTELLKSLVDGLPLKIEVVRNGEKKLFNGVVHSDKTPAFTLSTNSKAVVQQISCGSLKTLARAKVATLNYPVEILTVDGKKVDNRLTFRLPIGEHVIEIMEVISHRRLSGQIRPKYRKLTLPIQIKLNKQYTVSAKLKLESVRDKENYWESEIMEEDRKCSL